MKTTCHCQRFTVTTMAAGAFSGWALLLMPKCPACVAAYIALGTGIGLTRPEAFSLRIGLILLCVSILTFSILRLIRHRVIAKNHLP